MSFQAYLDNIKAKTGKTPDDFHALARDAGILTPGLKATEFVSWLAKDFDLGRGHAMAIWAVFTRKGWAMSPVRVRKERPGVGKAKAEASKPVRRSTSR